MRLFWLILLLFILPSFVLSLSLSESITYSTGGYINRLGIGFFNNKLLIINNINFKKNDYFIPSFELHVKKPNKLFELKVKINLQLKSKNYFNFGTGAGFIYIHNIKKYQNDELDILLDNSESTQSPIQNKTLLGLEIDMKHHIITPPNKKHTLNQFGIIFNLDFQREQHSIQFSIKKSLYSKNLYNIKEYIEEEYFKSLFSNYNFIQNFGFAVSEFFALSSWVFNAGFSYALTQKLMIHFGLSYSISGLKIEGEQFFNAEQFGFQYSMSEKCVFLFSYQHTYFTQHAHSFTLGFSFSGLFTK